MWSRAGVLLGVMASGCTSSAEPVRKDSPKPAVVEPPPPTDSPPVPKAISELGGALHLAAVYHGQLTIALMADDGVAVHGGGVLVFAGPGEVPLQRAPVAPSLWSTGGAAVGGRWPDQTFVTVLTGTARSSAFYGVRRWDGEAWQPLTLADAGVLDGYYSDYEATADGVPLGLRGYSYDTFLGDSDGQLMWLQERRHAPLTTIERLDGGPPPAWPPLPPGYPAVDLLTFADGTLIVLRTRPTVLRWSPGDSAWRELPAPPDRDRPDQGDRERPKIVGRDPDKIFASRCTHEKVPWLDRLTAGTWRPVAVPEGGCVVSLSEAPDGTLWLINGLGLHRHPSPGPQPDAPGRWESVPQGPQPLAPREVLTTRSGELWLAAAIAPEGDPWRARDQGHAVLTTRPVIAPLVLRPQDPPPGAGQPIGPLVKE